MHATHSLHLPLSLLRLLLRSLSSLPLVSTFPVFFVAAPFTLWYFNLHAPFVRRFPSCLVMPSLRSCTTATSSAPRRSARHRGPSGSSPQGPPPQAPGQSIPPPPAIPQATRARRKRSPSPAQDPTTDQAPQPSPRITRGRRISFDPRSHTRIDPASPRRRPQHRQTPVEAPPTAADPPPRHRATPPQSPSPLGDPDEPSEEALAASLAFEATFPPGLEPATLQGREHTPDPDAPPPVPSKKCKMYKKIVKPEPTLQFQPKHFFDFEKNVYVFDKLLH